MVLTHRKAKKALEGGEGDECASDEPPKELRGKKDADNSCRDKLLRTHQEHQLLLHALLQQNRRLFHNITLPNG